MRKLTASPSMTQRFSTQILPPPHHTSTVDIHPAAIGHLTKPQPKALWTAPLNRTLKVPIGSMWRKGKVAAVQFEHDKTSTIRKAFVSRSAALPKLESTSNWQLSQPVSAFDATHWLHMTSTAGLRTAPSAGMWMAPKKAIVSKKNTAQTCSCISRANTSRNLLHDQRLLVGCTRTNYLR